MRAALDEAGGKQVSGSVNGGYEQKAGSGKFSGKFYGSAGRKASFVKFDFTANGSVSAMGVDVKYKSVMTGVTKTHGKSVHVSAKYRANIEGTVHGKKATGKCAGAAKVWIAPGGVWVREVGGFHYTIDGKPVVGKYTVVIGKGALKVAVYGKYDGKKFFVNYGLSLNLLKLGLEMNPMMMTRKYGTVTTKIDGKEFKQSFDLNADELKKSHMQIMAPPMQM